MRCLICRLLFVPLFGVWLRRLFSLIFLHLAWRCVVLCRLCLLFWRRRLNALLLPLAIWLLRGVCGVLRARLFRGQAALALRAIWRRGRLLRCGVLLRRRSPLQQAWAKARAQRLFSCCDCVFSCRLRWRFFQAALWVGQRVFCLRRFQAAFAFRLRQRGLRVRLQVLLTQQLFPPLLFFQAAYRLWQICPRARARLRLRRRGVFLRARRWVRQFLVYPPRFQAAPAWQIVAQQRVHPFSGCLPLRRRVRLRWRFQAALLVRL